jgi:hypothetical protein
MTTRSSNPELGSVSVVHAGIEYLGEVVCAHLWDIVWGEQLRGDAYLRIVFIERFPHCEEWGIRLSAHLPTKDAESLGGYVHEAQREQNQCPSGYATSRRIQGQESNLPRLAQVQNPELVQFITKLLEQLRS